MRFSQMSPLFSVETAALPAGVPAAPTSRGGVVEAGQKEILAGEASPHLHARWSEGQPR